MLLIVLLLLILLLLLVVLRFSRFCSPAVRARAVGDFVQEVHGQP